MFLTINLWTKKCIPIFIFNILKDLKYSWVIFFLWISYKLNITLFFLLYTNIVSIEQLNSNTVGKVLKFPEEAGRGLDW